ncbi:hydrocephalus-inducing protein [Aplysia californica]|uniref:Hydrocephalus-inducing protein n=1 Tax=Aplysia californica TaxID=6500 RepID=A0ABM1VYZ3_APLCA|nr:hydrocephalus-inducing protein [Aplysia californica]
MPLGPFGEVVGTTGTLEALGPDAQNYKTKVIAPRNPKLVKQNEPDHHKMTPSKFLFDMSLSTEQKLANTHIMKVPRKTELLDMGDTSLQKFSKVNIDEPMFQPFPSEIYFQNFNPFEVYEVPLTLRNNDKVPRLVKVTQEDSPYFKVISPNDVGHKVGPGLPTTFRVQFMPDEKKDYQHELICITEREKFVVPVRAIGARGILDFPDEIRFPTCPVKYPNTKTLLVRNIGSREAKFSLKADESFSVTPDIGTLGVNDSIQVTVEFKPLRAGDHNGELLLTYDTGEEVSIALYGASQDANVRLDKNSIRIENTYISMANQRTVVITNRSDFIAHFRWTRFATQDDEDQQRLLQVIELDREENSDTDRFIDECVADPTLRDKLSILSRTFQNRKRAVENDPLLFDDDVMSIEPVEGDIWPNSSFEINVVFKPREATSYTRTAYCDITGRESRLPLRIRGDGEGPKVDFSFNHLDLGNIFIGSKHTYEIVIANKGDIDAIYSVVPNTSIFGPCFAFNPAEGIVMPGGHQAIQVAFNSPYLGDFEEVFCFQVDGQPQQCKIQFTGRVVGPTFNFDVAKLKFGTVPFGFLSSQVCHLVNTSLVPMVFHLRVPGDGMNKSVCCTHDIEKTPMEQGPVPMHDPREFEIIPSEGVIPPQSEIKVTVNLVPNTVKKYEAALVVDVERVGEEIMTLPISAKSMVPVISNLTPVLNYGRCFLRHPYEHRIRLHNDTELAAKYEIVPQEVITKDNAPISYQSPQPKGIIAPHSVADVPLLIKANALEEQEVPCLVQIFGSQDLPIAVHVICVGEGPVVHVSPLDIDWGDVAVLRDNEKTVVLSNESFIPAKFTAHMLRPNAVFRVSPSEGEIPPENSMKLTVTANLDDCVRFQDKLQINFLESQARLIPLQAYGKGTTIVSDPPLGPVLDLGPNFSNRQLTKTFKLTNRGRRLQQLVWLTDGYIPLSKAKKEKLRASVPPNKNTPALDKPSPIFQLTPNRMELRPGESVDFNIEGFVNGPQSVEETIVCHAIIGRAGGKIPIISVDIKADFIEPLLNFSTKCAFFRVDKEPDDELKVEQKQLVMNNVSSLTLTVGLQLASPFSMIIGDEKVSETEVCLQPEEVYYLVIEFDPMFKDDCHIRTVDEVLYITYKEHPHIDYVALRGEVYFPNLEFEKSVVDFGCILNDTEVTRYINITNNSPMEVRYHWSFLVGDVPSSVRKMPRPKKAFVKEMIEEECVITEVLEEEEATAEDENAKEAEVGNAYGDGTDNEEEREKVQEETMEVSVERAMEVVDGNENLEEKRTDDVGDDNRKDDGGSRPESPLDVDAPEKGQLDQEEKSDGENEKEQQERMSLGSRLSLREDEEEALRSNRVLMALLEEDEEIAPAIGVEEVFDILPLYGCLQPGDTEQVTFTFYGHADIWGEVKAICEVEGGPTYELKMTGEASLVEYEFNTKEIDYGKQMYDHVASSTITLINTGKVGFEFSGIGMDPALQKRPLPGQPVMVPHSGYIEPFAEQKIEVKFLPGVPENFHKSFQIQVAHFEPDSISLYGEGVFPRVSLDLPRLEDEEGVYAGLVKEAKENLARSFKKQQQLAALKADEGEIEEELMKLVSVEDGDGDGDGTREAGSNAQAYNSRKNSKASAGTVLMNSGSGPSRQSLKSLTFTPQEPSSSGIPIPLLEGAEGEAGDPGDASQAVARENAVQEEGEPYAEGQGGGDTGTVQTPKVNHLPEHEREPSELETQMEVERLAVRDFALERQNDSCRSFIRASVDDKGDNLLQPVPSNLTVLTAESFGASKPKPLLPDYLLDFGFVVLGTVRTHVVRATNTGWFPASFKLERQNIHVSGFHVELDRVRNLPGAPDNETLDFVVSFDPRGANLHLGAVEVVVPINIVNGPMLMMRLRAHVTMPDMEVSDDVLEFAEVKCGECKVITVQLHNHQMVKCEWDSTPTDDNKNIDKHVPMHLRRKIRQAKKKPRIFEVLPPTGVLMPGQRVNVQVKFMPTEEKFYENRIPIRIAQSSQRIVLLCHGQGLEPRLEFERTLVAFGPILPHSQGDDQEVVVRNPCSFPIEFYSLEFDSGYLEEEKVLRLMRGYDEYNTLLLPPRPVNEKLPNELLDFYDEQLKKLEEEEKVKQEAEAAAEAERREREEKEKEECLLAIFPCSALLNQSSPTSPDTPPPPAPAPPEEEKEKKKKEKGKKSVGKDTSKDKSGKEKAQKKTDEMEAFEAENVKPDKEKEAELLAGDDATEDTKGGETTPAPAILTTAPSRTATPNDPAAATAAATAPVVGELSAEHTIDEIAKKEDLLEEKMKESIASGPGVGELEITPVSAAIARHLGIDLTPEGKAARNRRGMAVIVHGAPLSGKTSTAVSLAKHYEAALLTVDGIVCDAIANGNTPAGLRARELCSEAAKRKAEELKEMEGFEGDKKQGGLSVEAVTAHTQGAAGAAGSSLASNKKTSTIVDQKGKDKPAGGKNTVVNSSLEGATGSQVPSSPPPLTAPIARRLSISASVAGEEGFLSCVLPEDLLVEILAERLQLNDCHRGVVFDGLETLFSQTLFTTANAILKALNNRRFIYFCTLKLDFNILKEQEKKAQEERELDEKKREEEEIQWLEDMDEDEYDALPEDVKTKVDQKRLVIKKERIKREQEEKAERERIERELREEEERRKEEEAKSRKPRKGKTPAVPDPKEKDKKTQTAVKTGQGSDRTQKSQGGARGHEGEKGPGSDRPESHATEKSDGQTEDSKKKKEKGKKDSKKDACDSLPLEEARDPAKEAEMLLMQRFRTFEAGQKDIQDLLEFWDRSTLQPRRPSTPSERSDEDQKDHPASGKKGKGKEKQDKEKLKEQERLRMEKELAEKAAKEAALAEGEDGDTVDAEEEKKEEVGVPNILIDCSDKTFTPHQKIMEAETLPTVEEEVNMSKNSLQESWPKKSRKKFSEDIKPKLNFNFNKDSKDDVDSKVKSVSDSIKLNKQSKIDPVKESVQNPPPKVKVLAQDTQKNKSSAQTLQKEKMSVLDPDQEEEKRILQEMEDIYAAGQNEEEAGDQGNPYANMTFAEMMLVAGKLPSKEDVLDGLGLGPQGPPLPPPASFGVIPFPIKRRPPQMSEMGGRYVFVASSPDDPNIGQDDKAKEADAEDESATTPDKGKDDQPTPTKGKGAKAAAEKGRTSTESKTDRKRSAERKKQPRRNSAQITSPPPGHATPVSDGDNLSRPTTGAASRSSSRLGVQSAILEERAPAKPLTIFRWTVAAGGEVTLKLRFTSDDLGQFDQTLNFEIVGTRRRYQMFCRGVCAFPTISKEPRIVFPSRKKNRRGDEIVHKKYILMTETFEFGPLLVGKSREKYREGKYPENMETFTVLNTSPLEADISFCFLHDSKAETYLLEPPTMLLKPGESDKLTVWAYPKGPGHYEDAVVCCVRENPEPIVFKLCCDGFRPELEVDKKQLHFDRVLLHRKDTKTIYLRNSTQLPVAWKLSGLENLGDDFTVAADSGIVEPLSEYPLQAYFRAMKAVQTTKKMIRIEIADADNIMGVVHTEAIQVIAEAYDVALDMSFPKGTDGGLDFGTIKVNEETKQTCTLKNKGKYEISFNFLLENVDPKNPDVTSLFAVVPNSGKLSPLDRPTQVQVIFKSSREVVVKDVPILKCQVIEPNLGEQGEMIASIPVKVSVKAVFSKFNISPTNDINFGSLLVNSKKTRTFMIENKGEFDFKYTISKKEKESNAQQNFRPNRPSVVEKNVNENKRNVKTVKGDKNSKSRDDSSSAPSIKPKKADSVSQHTDIMKPTVANENNNMARPQDAGSGQSKLTLGMFTIFPAFGMILPNGNQVITVDCVGENQGKEIQDISIDITERDPTTFKGGVPYRLVAEACIPTINVDDVGSIFEEHRVCKNLSVWQHMNCGNLDVNGVFGEEEKKFVFNNVIVGRKAKARFKISNTNKVPCDVVFTLKPVQVKGAPKTQDVFDLDPPRMQIANHSFMYATVTFTPPSMQTYSAVFEAAIEGVTPNQARGKSLVFEVSGEGNLPRITIAKPTVRNKRGQPLLLFKRILLGRTESLPFVLLNEGTLPSKVDIDLLDPDSAFMLKPTKATRDAIGDINYDDKETRRKPHTASVIVNPTERATFEVVYKPCAAQRSQANLKVTVTDNQYEDSVVQMVGEGYEDDITLDNIGSVFVPIDPEKEIGSMADDDVEDGEEEFPSEIDLRKAAEDDNEMPAAKPNLMQFGDCYINETRTLNLTMTNHSKTDCVRFKWPDHPQLKFSPQMGHLHGSCTKDVAVTFNSDSPKTFAECPIQCKVSKIVFDKPIDQICDWDDKIQVVKWVDIPPSPVQTADSPASGSEAEERKSHSVEDMVEILNSASKSNIPTTPRTHRPAKKKMIETEPEPQYTEVAESTRTVELLISAISDFTQCTCKVESVHFKDTLMFQTRVYSVLLQNEGQVALDYNWQVLMDSFTPMMQRSVTFMSEGERPESRVDVVETSYIPFLVEPQFGTIPAGKSASCVVKFAPLDSNDYEGRLICSIPFMSKEEQGPVIGLKGRSLMPYCHFELEDSDYLSSARRNPELRGPGGAPPGSTLDPNTRVIEFNVCGTGVRCYKEFGIVNPTNEPFVFEWMCEDESDPKRPSCFQCIHPEGQVKSGRKFKSMSLSISKPKVIQKTLKQNILANKNQETFYTYYYIHIYVSIIHAGREAVETIYINSNEETPFNFSFVEDSCHSEGYASHIRVQPMHGQIPPKSSVPVDLFFSPTSEKEVNFNLRCVIPRKVAPITLNVKAEGYAMNSILQCEDSTGNRVELSDRGLNQINFGEVEVNENAIRHLFILNSGKFNFDYTWEFSDNSIGKDAITVSPDKGGVMCGETQQISLMFCPSKRMSVRGCEAALKVANGPTYHISILGLGVTPGLHFSFQTFNFGNCFIHKTGLDLPTKQAVLRMTNKDKKEISVDCLYEGSSVLTYKFEACVVAPNDTVEVPFTFCPRQPIKYHETVVFEINGLSKQKVEFYGTGSEMKIEVADPKQKSVNLGARVVGDTVKKYIPIVNNSPAPITFNLALTPTEPALQHKEVLAISPKDQITLDARGGTTKVEVWFRPKARIPQFTEEVLLECAGMSQPLFVVKGSCLGMEISLDSDSLSFGTVYQRSSSSRKLVMSNTGDMNTKFRWDVKRFKPDFSISPEEGYITPGMDVTFDVEFHPQNISGDVRYDKLKCLLDGGPHKPVTLTLTGSCTGIPPVKEVQNFQAVVRQSDTKQLMIPNKSNQLWNLKPIIDGEHWTGPITFMVEPQQTKGYELTYKPLTMTSENKKHMGSIFFPLPDGSGLLFNLTGSSDPPKATSKIQRDVPCKTGYTELLTVTNWLKKPQRFRVRTESLRPDKLDPGTSVKGHEYVDVPASSKKDYKLSFYAYREGQTMLKVTFVNEQTGEYQFYEVTFRATKPGVISAIQLSTPVRQSVPHTVTVENPLSYQVNFSISCSVPEVLIPNQLAVPANSQGHFSFEYQPLKVGEVQGRLELNCSDLGLYTYDLTLTATPGAPEKAIYFRTGLGSSNMQLAKFLNFAKQRTDYVCKIDNSDFHVDKSVAAAPGSTGGTEVALEVVFEPSKLGEQRAMLSVTSQLGGEYVFPLFGTSTAPKPQGPFIVKAGSTTPIMFRNVFSSTTPFTFQVDNPLFHLTKQGESIRAHKDHRIVVGFDGNDSGSKAAVMGKLIVSCARSAGGNSNVQWVFYLKGVTP